MIDIKNITVYRHSSQVLDGFSLRVDQGEKMAVLGPNGAGKSTLLKILARDIYPRVSDDSYVKMFGKENIDVVELRKHMGIISQDLQEDYTPYTSGLQVVLSGFFGAIGAHGHLQTSAEQDNRAQAILQQLGMGEFADTMYQRLSTGQKRRLLVARALINEPDTLIFDEPCTGLDVQAAYQLLGLMRTLCNASRTLVLTTHHVEEIIPEIERVVLLKQGRVLADGNKRDIMVDDILSELYDMPIGVENESGWYRLHVTAHRA